MISTEGWKTYRLGDCVNFLSGGTPSKKNPEYWDGDIPWVSCKDMKTTYLSDSQDHITEAGAANGTRLVSPGTILIVVRGMILSQHFPVAIAKRKMAFNQDLKALQCAPNVDQKFLFHWLQGKSYEILGIADEAAHGTKRLQTDRLQNFPLHLPPLPLQRKIATILSAYDDLIENNRRRIEILEEMARSLYREWFVNFRFPGHEQVKMVDSELGLIPEGWEVKQLGNIVLEIIDYRGKTPKKLGSDWSESGILAISAKNIKQGKLINLDKSNFVDEALYNKWMKSELKQGDILMTSEAPLGELYYLVKHQKFCLSQRVYSIRANPDIIKPSILFSALYSPLIQEQIYARQSGTTVLGIRQTELRKVPVIVPSINLQTSASQILDDLFKSIETLQRKNANLRQTRDLLLPKLISGEIDVENLDINTGEIAA